MRDWQKQSAMGVRKQIKKSLAENGKLLDCWKHYLKSMNRNSLEIMKALEPEFMTKILTV